MKCTVSILEQNNENNYILFLVFSKHFSCLLPIKTKYKSNDVPKFILMCVLCLKFLKQKLNS